LKVTSQSRNTSRIGYLWIDGIKGSIWSIFDRHLQITWVYHYEKIQTENWSIEHYSYWKQSPLCITKVNSLKIRVITFYCTHRNTRIFASISSSKDGKNESNNWCLHDVEWIYEWVLLYYFSVVELWVMIKC